MTLVILTGPLAANAGAQNWGSRSASCRMQPRLRLIVQRRLGQQNLNSVVAQMDRGLAVICPAHVLIREANISKRANCRFA